MLALSPFSLSPFFATRQHVVLYSRQPHSAANHRLRTEVTTMIVEYWFAAVLTAIAVIVCIVLHYECLRLLSERLPLPVQGHRPQIVLIILSVLLVHIAEIWIFGAGYYALLSFGENGSLSGAEALTLVDCVYYSATVFSTVGFGDIIPTGAIRLMTGTEAIAGLTFITWSASYAFLVMQKTWSFERD
jgi:hypothetical protein